MDNKIFSEKSMEYIKSPEQLNDYLHVTNLSVWVLMIAVVIFLVGLIVWSSFTYFFSYVDGHGLVDEGVMRITFEDQTQAQYVEPGMKVSIGSEDTTVLSVGKDDNGAKFAVANTELSDGAYDCYVYYNSQQLIKLLFN